jgi:hypothetical protein
MARNLLEFYVLAWNLLAGIQKNLAGKSKKKTA